ncbi:cysteine/serine-rich nuclear protein 2 [Denticeps clupeoides]|uniref:Cysteine/serine-rich nuclear protein N-terminal domain-containing protein n=1 Tax=Denticeps clupeoides TaxID=299321 RepID=A0AAY4CKN4_9TELE|nr:cysteine/serine-rich nuclear protein 2 [Denticeps clupeoides]
METVAALGLKRRFEEVDSGSPYSTPKDSDDDISCSDSADSCDSLNAPCSSHTPTSILRRPKSTLGRKRVRFDAVTVYYFSRRQGFTSVPSQGGSSLGMARHHCAIRHYTLGEFAREQESSHRHALRQHLRQQKLNARKMKLTRNGTVECAQADLLTLDDVSDEDLDLDAVEVDDCFFLQPLPTKRRRALLRASGIARIDAREKAELRAIRLSREECGCDCRLYCDPRHCGCSQAGIKCQVDRMSFPCGCSRDGCGNAAGRIEFNPLRVRTHYLHTIMKLDLEKRKLLGVSSAVEEELSSSPSDFSNSDQEVEVQAAQDLLAQHDSLERENETAVLHLQSAEEQERRREHEDEEAQQEEVQSGPDPALCLLSGQLTEQLTEESQVDSMEGVLIQGEFPGGATLVCIADNQDGQQPQDDLLKDHATPLLYYQIGQLEAGTFEMLSSADKETAGGETQEESVGETEGGGNVQTTKLAKAALCPEAKEVAEEGSPYPLEGNSDGPCQVPEPEPPRMPNDDQV